MALVIATCMGAMTMRSCQSSSGSSPSNPANMAKIGTAGICANQQAVADSGSPDDPVPAVTLPPDLAASLGKADPNAAAIVAEAANCPPATTVP